MKVPSHHNGLRSVASPPSRGAWIESYEADRLTYEQYKSPPSRGAWIERSGIQRVVDGVIVAPLTGGVD